MRSEDSVKEEELERLEKVARKGALFSCSVLFLLLLSEGEKEDTETLRG